MNQKTSHRIFLLVVIALGVLGCNIPVMKNISLSIGLATHTPESDSWTATPTTTATDTATPTFTYTATGTQTSTGTATATETPDSPECNRAEFVWDVNYPDGSYIHIGTVFDKTWRIRNVGTCTWTPKYKLVFQSGDAMGAPATLALTNSNVPPNSNLNISVKLTSPQDQGTYQGYFKMRAPDGTVFGIAPNGANPFWVMINVVPPSVDTPTFTPGPLIPIKPKLTLVVPPVLIPPSP